MMKKLNVKPHRTSSQTHNSRPRVKEGRMVNLNRLSLGKYRFTLRTKGVLALPPYKGSVFRGGFGSVFRGLTCINKKKECANCLLANKCIYSYIFETSPPPSSSRLSKYKNIPHPFVLEPPLEKKREYAEGEILSFNLVLIGRAIGYLPYFVFAFRRLGEIGLGKKRGRYEITRVDCLGNHKKTDTIYDNQTQTLRTVDTQIDVSKIFSFPRTSGSPLTLKFITPTRIKYQGTYTSHPDFHIIFRSLLRRLSSLAYFHCGEELDVNYKQMIREAKEVKTLEINLNWIDWERYSARQQQRMKLGGFVGRVTYQGDMAKFHPFLKIGEYVHLGKAAVFGLGKYEIEKS